MPGKKSSSNPRRKRGNGNGSQRSISLMPVYNADPIQTRKLRFQYVIAGTTPANITSTSLNLTNLYGCAKSTTQIASVMSAMRLTRIRVWTFGVAGSLQASTVSVTWLSQNGPAQEVAVTGNADHPGCLDARPPLNALSSFWYNSNNTTNLFTLLINPGDYVEITLQYTPSNSADLQIPFFTAGTTVLVAGQYYYTPLNGAGGNIIPVANPIAT